MVDFLCCVFPELSNLEKGLVRRASTGRNSLSYDDPRVVDTQVCKDILTLAEKLLTGARSNGLPTAAKEVPPPPRKPT